MTRHLASSSLALLLACAGLHADTVVFKNGQILEGEVLDKDDATIQLKVEYGTMKVPLDKIARIEEDTPEKIKAREKKAEEEKELAAQMKEEGKVLYKGEWVTEQEKKAADDKAAAAKKQKDQKRAEAKKKAEQEQQKREQEAAQRQQQWQQQQQAYNNSGMSERGMRYADRHNRDGGRNNSGYSNYGSSGNYNRYGNSGNSGGYSNYNRNSGGYGNSGNSGNMGRYMTNDFVNQLQQSARSGNWRGLNGQYR